MSANHQEVRRGVTQANFNGGSFTIIAIEIAIIAIFFGFYFKSWWWGGGLYLALLAAIQIRILSLPVMLAGSLLWGLAGFLIGSLFGSYAAQIDIGAISLIIGLGVHFTAIQWADDLTTQ